MILRILPAASMEIIKVSAAITTQINGTDTGGRIKSTFIIPIARNIQDISGFAPKNPSIPPASDPTIATGRKPMKICKISCQVVNPSAFSMPRSCLWRTSVVPVISESISITIKIMIAKAATTVSYVPSALCIAAFSFDIKLMFELNFRLILVISSDILVFF